MVKDHIVFLAWESPPKFIYGGQGVFLDHLLTELSKQGYEITMIGCSPDPTDYGKTFKDHYTTIMACTVTDLLEENIREMNRQVITEASGIIRSADFVVVSDFHLALTTAVVNTNNLAMYTHSFFPHPSTYHLYLRAKNMVNSKLTYNVVRWLQKWVSGTDLVSFAVEGEKEPFDPVIVYPAVPLETEGLEPRAPRGLEGIAGKYVLAFMRNQFNKGKDVFLKAMKYYNEKLAGNDDVYWVIAGRGWEPRTSSKLVILGEVSREEKKWLMENALVGVLPSTYEPFGLVALEYIYHGTPVITSENCGVNEVLGETAMIYKDNSYKLLARKIKRVINERERILEQQRKKGLTRTWSDVASDFLDVLLE